MTKDSFDVFIEGIRQTMKAASERAAPHFKGVIEASEALISDLSKSGKAFKKMEKRVERKLRDGIRRTKADPV